MITSVEDRLEPFGARPHWRKLFRTSPQVIHDLCDRMPDFRRLAGRYDPTGKFGNDFMERYVDADRR